MMRIALFSDIHANLPALEACLQSIDQQKPDAVFCLGDLVGYNVWPNEVINEIRRRRIPTIAGNYDQGIGLASDNCGCAYKTEHDKAMGAVSINFTNSIVNTEERNYLRTLPMQIKVAFEFGDHKVNLLLVHGSPRRINEYLFEDRDESSLVRIMTAADADIMCFGHTHKPWHKILPAATVNGSGARHAINIGSVGKPKDNNPKGCYVLFTLHAHSAIEEKWAEVEFIRFDYDIERAATAVEHSPLPKEYADMLRQGR